MDPTTMIQQGTSGAMEYVFGGLFVLLFVYVLWDKRQLEVRLLDHQERMVKSLENIVQSMSSLPSEVAKLVRKEITELMNLLRGGGIR